MLKSAMVRSIVAINAKINVREKVSTNKCYNKCEKKSPNKYIFDLYL